MLIPEDQLWMVIVGFIIAFVLAFGIGANDVANTFGSSVGSGVLTLKQACTLATICELLGALLLGSRVSSTIRKGIVDTSLFDTVDNGTEKLMAGQVAALGGSCSWLLVATFFRLPVSGTHSIVGATVGFSLVLFGVRAIKWAGLGKVVASWFLSPVLSGLLSVGIFAIIQALVLAKEESLERAVNVLPGFYGFMVVINLITILIDGSEVFQFNKVPIYGMFIISFGCGTITVICIKFIFVPYLRRRILAGENAGPGLGARLSRKLGFMKLSHLYQSLRRKKKHKSCATNERTSPQTLDQTISTLRHSADHNWDGRKMHSLELHENIGTNSNANGIAVQMVHCQHPFNDNGWQQRPRSVYVSATENDERISYCFSNKLLAPPPILSLDETDTHLPAAKREVISDSFLPVIEEEFLDQQNVKDRPTEARVFGMLQMMTCVLDSFAHGGNDVSNAIGPLMGLWIVGVTQDVNSKMANPYWILIYGGLGIAIGLWVWGRRVIQTLGKDLTKITPTSGVSIELGSALTVLLASKVGLPVSTTHCQVGSVICVGRYRSRDNVNWGVFRNIAIAWVVTVPASGGISALLMYLFSFAL